MKFKPELEALYHEMKKTNHEQGGEEDKQLFRYAERWAEAMEKIIDEGIASGYKMDIGKKDQMITHDALLILSDIAGDLAGEADVVTDRITRKIYGWAVAVLAKHWIYGEQLRIWHNLTSQLKHEGEEANLIPGKVLDPMNVNAPKEK